MPFYHVALWMWCVGRVCWKQVIFSKASENYKDACGCWQLHPPACISWYSSVSDASWMWTRGVQNHSSHDIISNPFWVLFPGGKGNQSDRKRKIFQAKKQCFTVDKVLQLRRLSTGPSSQRWHAASWHFSGLCWERVNAMWAVVNLRSKKNREEKGVENCNINFQRLWISTQMAQIFLGVGTHTIGIQPDNYQSFKVDNMGLTVKLRQ